MHLLHAIPNLLQLVHDAEDDGSALGVGCAWLERHAGVDRAAMVTTDGGRLLAKRGVGPRGEQDRDRIGREFDRARSRGDDRFARR